MSATASGSPNIQYQWQDSTASGTWQNVSEVGGNTSGFVTDPLSQTTWYRIFVYATESGCEDIYSQVVTVVVSPDISISVQPVGGSICTGGNFDLSVTASGSPDIHYQWQSTKEQPGVMLEQIHHLQYRSFNSDHIVSSICQCQ